MRSLLVVAALFVVGGVVGIRLLAALYGPLDLWYTIRTAWPVVVRRIVLWGAVAALGLVWLEDTARIAFGLGMAAYLVAHVASWFLITHSFPRKPGPTAIVE